MIHATLQIRTSSHWPLKTLAIIKDSSGKPILLCCLTPRKKNEDPKGVERSRKKNEEPLEQTVQQSYAQKWTQPSVKRIKGAAPRLSPLPLKKTKKELVLALRFSKPQSQRRRILQVSFLKKLASRQSTAGKRLYDPLLANNDALNIMSKRLTHPGLPFNHSAYEPSLYSNQNLSGGNLFKSLQGLRHKPFDLELKLLGLKLAKACILKGIQSIDVVIQKNTKPICLLLQGLRMAGIRFNRLRILRAADYNYDVDFVSDRKNQQLALARENSRSFFPSLKEFGKDPHVAGEAGGKHRGDNSRPIPPLGGGDRWKKGGERRATQVAALPGGPSFLLRSSTSDYLPFGQSKTEDVNLTENNRGNFVSWLFDIRPKYELFQILVKSRLIKKSNRQTFWQVRSSNYKIEKLLYRKNRIGVIKERVYCPLIQKKAVKEWKAFTSYSTAFRAKQQRTPFYRLRRNTSPFVSQSSSKSSQSPRKAALLFGRGLSKKSGAKPLPVGSAAKQKKTSSSCSAPFSRKSEAKQKKHFFSVKGGGGSWAIQVAPSPPLGGGIAEKKRTFFCSAPLLERLTPPVELHSLSKVEQGHSQKRVQQGHSQKRVQQGHSQKRVQQSPPQGGGWGREPGRLGSPSFRLHLSLAKGGVTKRGVQKRIQKKVAWLRRSLLRTSRKYGKQWSLSFRLQKRRGFQKRRRFHYRFAPIIANVQNTLNNTIITITDRSGNTKVWCSSGSIGLKASRRSTNYAAQSVAEAVAQKCRKLGIKRVEVRVQGVGYGKPSALKGLRIGGLKIKRIVDRTSKPHNGCRAPKKRRV